MSAALKSIATNTLAQLFAKFVGAGLTFITTAIIIRLSGPDLFGDLTKSLVLIAIGFTAIDFGLNATTVRVLHGAKQPKLLMADVISARLVLSVLMVLITNLGVVALPGGYTPEIKAVFWIGSLAIIFQGLYTSMNAWFQYQERYWSASVATIGGTLFGTALTYYYALHAPTLSHFLIATTGGYLLMALLSIYLARDVFSLSSSPLRLKRLFAASLTLGGVLLASVVASKLDTIILGIYRAPSEVGEYGFAYRIFDVLLVLPVFIMNAVYPRLIKGTETQAKKLIRRSLPFMGALGIMLALVSWTLAPWILLIRPGLTLSVSVLKTLSFSIPLFFVTAPLMWHLVSRRQEKTVLTIYCAAALFNGVLNLWFIPSSGALAAAIITGATELGILLALLYHSHYETTA